MIAAATPEKTVFVYFETSADGCRAGFMAVPDEGVPTVRRFLDALRTDRERGPTDSIASGRVDGWMDSMTAVDLVTEVATVTSPDGNRLDDPVVASWDDGMESRLSEACDALDRRDRFSFDQAVLNSGLFHVPDDDGSSPLDHVIGFRDAPLPDGGRGEGSAARMILTYTETDEDEKRICFLPVPDEGIPVAARFLRALREDQHRGDGLEPVAAGRVEATVETMTDDQFVGRIADEVLGLNEDSTVMVASWDNSIATRMTRACLALDENARQDFDRIVCDFGLFME